MNRACLQNIEAMRALHRMASIGTAVGSVPSPKNQCLNETPVPAVGKNFFTMVGRESWLHQFYRNAAILNFDLRLWMPALNDFTLPGGLIIGLRCLGEALVLPNDVSFAAWNHFANRGL
jgi:hypothetical protein